MHQEFKSAVPRVCSLPSGRVEGSELESGSRSEPDSDEALREMMRNLPEEQEAQLARLLEAALKKARRNGFTSKYFLKTFAGEHYSEEAFEDVLSTLRTDDPHLSPERVVCAWILGIAPLRPAHRREAAQALQQVLEHARSTSLDSTKNRWLRALNRSFKFSLLSCGSLALAADIVLLFLSPAGLPDIVNLLFASGFLCVFAAVFCSLALFPIILPFSLQADRNARNPVRLMAARSLGRLGSLESLGTLAKACLDGGEGIRRLAFSALFVLLPQLTPEHHGQLGGELVPGLCRLLAHTDTSLFDAEGQAEPLSSELLKALEKIGDSRAIPTVTQVAQNGRTGRLKAQAHRILGILELRKQREIERDTLLRGARSPAPRSDQLLRPADGQSASHPEQLLRPID